MSTEGFNRTLWAIQTEAGWWFWVPFIAYGSCGLYIMYSLAAAETHLGRTIRVLLTLAYLSMIFIFAFNALGGYAFHLLAIGSVLIIYQQYQFCKASGKIKPATAETALGRVVERMVEPRA
jgi:hypothetical protein